MNAAVLVLGALLATGAAGAQPTAVTAGGPAARAPATDGAAIPAQWRSYDVLLDFQHLPRSYSCDELWYRFRALLLQLGARAYMSITPYHCGYLGGGEARSPQVEMKFQLPYLLQGSAAKRYAELNVVTQTLRLAPGQPPPFTAADCELMRQAQEQLFSMVPLRVTASSFKCRGTPGSARDRPSFVLTVDASRVASPHS